MRLSGWCASHGEQQHARCRSAECECLCGVHPRVFVQVRGRIPVTTAVSSGTETRYDSTTTSTANEVARATAAKRSPGPDESLVRSDPT